MHNKDMKTARMFIYNLLALLFVEEHTKQSTPMIIDNLSLLSQNGFNDEVSIASSNIVNLLKNNELNHLNIEYQQLFLIPFGNPISLSASWYHNEREAGLMLIKVRDVIAKTKIRRDEALFSAPEDHFGFIFALSAYLIEDSLDDDKDSQLQKELFINVINPFVDQLAFRLIASEKEIYQNVGVILGNFCNFERTYFGLE